MLSLVLRTPTAVAHAPTQRRHRSDRCRWVSRPGDPLRIVLRPPRGVRAELSRRCVVLDPAGRNARLEHGDVWRVGRGWRSELGGVRDTKAEAVADSLAAHNLAWSFGGGILNGSDVPWSVLVAWAEAGAISMRAGPPMFLGWCPLAVHAGPEDGCVWCERITLPRDDGCALCAVCGVALRDHADASHRWRRPAEEGRRVRRRWRPRWRRTPGPA